MTLDKRIRMTTAELSKRFLQLWQNAEWESFGDLLSKDIELKIVGLSSKIKGINRILRALRLDSNKSINQDTKLISLTAGNNFGFLQLESTRNYFILGVPADVKLESELRSLGGLSKKSTFKTGILLEWGEKKKVIKITVIDTYVSPPEIAIYAFDGLLNIE